MLIANLLNTITLLLWIVVTLYIIVVLAQSVPRVGLPKAIRRLFSRSFVPIILLVIGVTVLSRSLVFIEPQESAVVISLIAPEGYQDQPLRSGLHWIAPLVETVYRYPISWQTYTMSSNPSEGQNIGNDSIIARTQDGQEVMIDSSIIYRLDADQVIRIHIDWQDRYLEDFIRPTVRNMVRNLASQYTADEINSSRRINLETDLNELLQDELANMGFIMDAFLLRNVSFSPEYASAIEDKQVAQQAVIESQYQATQMVVIAEAEADAIRRLAEANADALALIANELEGNPDLLVYNYIERLAPNISVMLVPNDAPFLLPLPSPAAIAIGTPAPDLLRTPVPDISPLPGGVQPTITPLGGTSGG